MECREKKHSHAGFKTIATALQKHGSILFCVEAGSRALTNWHRRRESSCSNAPKPKVPGGPAHSDMLGKLHNTLPKIRKIKRSRR